MKASSSYENFVPCCKHYNIFTMQVLHKRWDNKTCHLFQQIWVQDLSHAAELGNQKQNLSLGQAISAKLQSIIFGAHESTESRQCIQYSVIPMFIQGNEGDGCRCSDEGTLSPLRIPYANCLQKEKPVLLKTLS